MLLGENLFEPYQPLFIPPDFKTLFMRGPVISSILGKFLKVFSLIVILPVPVGLYYNEPWINLLGYVYSSFACILLGWLLGEIGDYEEPSVGEAMIATVSGWMIAVLIGAIPFYIELNLINAVFEAMAGLTTTGISVFTAPEQLPHSMLFWRALMQWIGGLGVLTFFIAVIRESGGISRKLFSAETHKADPGSIRPSLRKSIIELWKVYLIITVAFIGLYYAMGVSLFDSVAHSFSGISTGGFSTSGESIGMFNHYIQFATIFMMFLGGTNFVVIHKIFNLDFSSLKNSEFKFYTGLFLLFSGVITFDIWRGGLESSLLDAVFQSASIVSSTGYGTMDLMALSAFVQFLLIGLMFVGGSVGSTSGGIKSFRFMALIKLVKTRVKSVALPETAVNEVTVDGEILENDALRMISVLFFSWLMLAFLGTAIVMLVEDISLMGALSGTVSAAGNMGPVFSATEIASFSPLTKLVWIFSMLAGRLEMIPLLAIFNRKVISN
jgi:trk system potassium uptake protein TrkH